MSTFVTVLSKEGTALAPTKKCAYVRILLKKHKAKVVTRRPFTIQLLYDVRESHKPYGETLGIDPGRTNIGLATVRDDGTCTFLADAITRNKEVPRRMKERAAFRRKHRTFGRRTVRQRRARKAGTIRKPSVFPRLLPQCQEPVQCHWIRNKKARFCNRRRPVGWLTPTARHLLESHKQLVRRILQIRPVKRIVVEMNVFDFVAMEHPGLRKQWYGRGPLQGTGGLHKAVSLQQGGKCLLCGKQPIQHDHHIVPRHKNGADTITNIAGLCKRCHDLVHKDSRKADRLARKKAGINKRYHALSTINQILPAFVRWLVEEYPGVEVVLTRGWDTKAFRENSAMEKDHCLDAYAIACCGMGMEQASVPDVHMNVIRQFRRQDRQACHKEMLSRKYYLDGKHVATNRHKAADQKAPSLAEFRECAATRDLSRLTVKAHPAVYKDPRRVMPGAVMQCGKRLFVLARTDGRHKGKPDYYVGTNGRKYACRDCRVIIQNRGFVFVA